MRDPSPRRASANRCAIYTRKSSEEGLEQDFNSLHAQREACEAYVTSQRHEGWVCLAATYNDGGFSGGTLERPGLRRLLADIEAGTIDVVVVYKVDRLTRSLTDFARIVEIFDRHGVSFVSVTQSFNTTSSMGRLTLNVLLSFAQFEREVTGERIRDKIAASKKKGMWMGGYVPIGYVADNRTLAIMETDAALVRHMFDRFIILGSIQALKDELDRDGLMRTPFVSKTGRSWGAKPFSIGHLRIILTNAIYIGEINHKGQRYRGQHPPLIDRKIFQAVQDVLDASRRGHYLRPDIENASLLAHLVYDAAGTRLRCTHGNGRGRRYRYYTTQPGADETIRLRASDIELLVIRLVTERLEDASRMLDHCVGSTTHNSSDILKQAAMIASDLHSGTPAQQREILQAIIAKIVISIDGIDITMKPDLFAGHVFEQPIVISIDRCFAVKGPLLRLVVPPSQRSDDQRSDMLVKALARSVTWYQDIKSGNVASFREIAERESVTERYVAQLIRLAFLAPDLVERVIDSNIALPISGADIAHGLDLALEWYQQHWMINHADQPRSDQLVT